jgi:acyl transferase domain-containing protein
MSEEFDIAIVGMSGRWPGARTLADFWRNLAEGVESITRLSDEELLESGVSRSQLSDRRYVKAAPVLDEPGHFDAAFFGFSPLEARTMDPQHRILLELAHEALEHAGCDPDRFEGRVGVFTGSAMNTYFMAHRLNRRFAEEYIPTLIGTDKDFLSTRISYKLNLKGPSITVQTACSTSLTAVHLARQSLLSGETDLAVAGAISVRVPHRAGYLCDDGGIVSGDGHVRAFDGGANGTVFGSGGGILVLKRLSDAIASGDTIHAVIKGSAVNNDGSQKAGYTAPSVNGQTEVVSEALANAGVAADDISYVEAHGSGTPVGDPIEIKALTSAFRASTRRSGYCAIGSVKTNIGHLDAAAGVAGLIKTVLSLEHRQLPPTLHFKEANPEIDFAKTPFYVNTRLLDWKSNGPRRAGVMATGMGGTNAFVVLEQAPAFAATANAPSPQLLVLSAKTETALDQSTHRLRDFLNREPLANLDDVAGTLQLGRKAFPHRRAVVCVDRQDAIAALSEIDPTRAH